MGKRNQITELVDATTSDANRRTRWRCAARVLLAPVQSLTADRSLFAILMFGALLGLYGLWWGGAEDWNPDQMALRKLSLFENKGKGILEPPNQLKPPFHTYFVYFTGRLPVAIAEKVASKLTGTKVDLKLVEFLWARGIQLLLFLGIAFVSHHVVARSAGRTAGHFVAAATVTCAGLMVHKNFLTADIPVTFWMLVSFWFAQSIGERKGYRDYLLAGLFTGVATATKYNGLAVGLAIPVFHWIANRERPFLRMAFDPRHVAGVSMVVVAFVLANPYSVLNHRDFIDDFYYNYVTTPVYDGQVAGSTSYLLFLRLVVAILGGPLAIAVYAGAAASAVLLWRWEKRASATAAATLGVSLLYFYQFGGMPRLVVRFVLPVVPFLMIAAGLAWARLHVKAPRVMAGAMAVIVVYGTVASFYLGYRFVNDPRMKALDWVASHVGPTEAIESSDSSPSWNRHRGINVKDRRFENVSGRRKVLTEVFWESPKIKAMVEARELDDGVTFYDAEELAARSPDFIAVNSLYYERFHKPPHADHYPVIREYFDRLLAEELGYRIVFDGVTPAAPAWLYPRKVHFLENRMVILERADRLGGEP